MALVSGGGVAQTAPPPGTATLESVAADPVVRPLRRTVQPRSARASAMPAAGGESAAEAAEVLGAAGSPPSIPAGVLDLGNGLSFVANYTGQSAFNPVGGMRQGSAYASQAYLGIDGDMQRLAGVDGGSFHVVVSQRHGRSLSNDFIGNNTSVQEIFGGGQTARLTLLSYQQKLFDNKLDIEFGRLSTNPNFLSSSLYCNFQTNATCGGPTSAFKITNLGFWPISTWGAHAKVWLTDKIFVHGGVYEVNPYTQRPTDNGVDWSTRGATGVTLPYEIGYSTTFANDVLPRNYNIGGVVDRSDYADPVLDTRRGAALFSGLDRLTQFGRSLVYARFDQMVWRPDPTAQQGLTLFGVAIKGTDGRQINDYYLAGGAALLGTFPSRPYDTLGFVVSTQKFSSVGLANVRAARASLGLDSRDIATQQVMLEVNYGIQVTPAIRLMPNLQYIVNPDNTRFPFRPKPTPNAFVVGTKLSIDLFTLGGFAKGPGSL
ncbi:carbohydrate porin [Methylobacterium sp. BTF04]|uniref:carbohydrate porin n=1 Tax=Methylobacterium sp. BTF04 TaxID=2708300 RepID=UPI0013D6082B|nr:carbohydrate porin [Methylobacterium sp. BTF04]NEU12872.1 carbohydrate porin [Methylobacterium sp. BTF04]